MNACYRYIRIRTTLWWLLLAVIPSLFLLQCDYLTKPIDRTTDRFTGICYGPYRDNHHPEFGIHPTIADIAEDLVLVEKLTHAVRTYSVNNTLAQIPSLAALRQIDCYPSAWISNNESRNDTQVSTLIHVANQNLQNVKGLVVGNEVLLRNEMSEQQLIEYISRVKDATDAPVGYADIWAEWLNHPELAQSVDILFVHIYPYWDGIGIDDAASYVLAKWNEVKERYPNKAMILGETGWPTQGRILGEAVPSEENQRKYVNDIRRIAQTDNIPYFYFEVFDEKWKINEGGMDVGDHWGMYYSNGSPKPLLVDLLPESARTGIPDRCRTVTTDTIEASLPLFVYSDAADTANCFIPSGWMGEFADSSYFEEKDPKDIFDEECTETPFSGRTCIRISYIPSNTTGWAGIYWQYPLDNWGNCPGYDLSEFSNDDIRLAFHARGEISGEIAKFITGGISDTSRAYCDSYGPLSTGVCTLTNQWQEYSIPLTNYDLTNIIGGFCWVTENSWNSSGATIYLDDIRFEIPEDVGIVERSKEQPTRPYLKRNCPNPFNPLTTIRFTLPEVGVTNLVIYDVLGRAVRRLVSGPMEAGMHSVAWDGCDMVGRPVASGVYIYRLTTTKETLVRRMTLVR